MEKNDRKINAYRLLCFSLSIAALLLSCLRWYLGLSAAIASVVFAFLHGKHTKKNDPLVITGLVISVMYIFVYILVLIIGASYMSGLKISPFRKQE